MPKNKGKGGKNRRRGKNENEDFKRELILREPGQCYGQVVRMLGSSNVEAMCFDNVKRICHIRGKMRKRIWINVGDIVLIGKRDFQDSKGDIIQKYFPDEAKNLKDYGELPTNIFINEGKIIKNEDHSDDCLDQAFEFDSNSDKTEKIIIE